MDLGGPVSGQFLGPFEDLQIGSNNGPTAFADLRKPILVIGAQGIFPRAIKLPGRVHGVAEFTQASPNAASYRVLIQVELRR